MRLANRSVIFACQALCALALVAAPVTAMAGGRLASVVPQDAGCVAGPTGNASTESWDVEPGRTYRLTFADITNCANGGTDATISIMIKNTFIGNACYTASFVSTGVYQMDYLVPNNTCETSPIKYCVTSCKPTTGFDVGKQDGSGGNAHLRAAAFAANCSAPSQITCNTPVQPSTWGSIKVLYR